MYEYIEEIKKIINKLNDIKHNILDKIIEK